MPGVDGVTMADLPPLLGGSGNDSIVAEHETTPASLGEQTAFSIVALIRNQTFSEEIADYAGLGKQSPLLAVCMLICLVSLVGIPGQIWLGHLSDRIGREWIWSISSAGFVICFLALIALPYVPSLPLLYLMVFVQGFLGYGFTSIIGAVTMEIFEGKQFGSIYGSVTLVALAGGAANGAPYREQV